METQKVFHETSQLSHPYLYFMEGKITVSRVCLSDSPFYLSSATL
jgi:hypothetical protein